MEKTDKIIAAVCAVIIVLAGIGIWYSLSSKPSVKPKESVKAFEVIWEKETGSLPDIEGYASDRIFGGEKPYVTNVTIDEDNIDTINFTLTWKDDHTYGLFKKKGLDELTLIITSPDGVEICNETTVGNATLTITARTGFIPTLFSAEAKDYDGAERMVKENYSHKWKGEPFKIYVKVKVGEKIFRPLKRLRDKGNNFTISISYTYYEAKIVEKTPPKETESMASTTSEGMNEMKALEMILKMGSGRV